VRRLLEFPKLALVASCAASCTIGVLMTGCGGDRRDSQGPILGLADLVDRRGGASALPDQVENGVSNDHPDGTTGGTKGGTKGGTTDRPVDERPADAGDVDGGSSTPSPVNGPDSDPRRRAAGAAPPDTTAGGDRGARNNRPPAAGATRTPSQRSDWIVDGLVGQINGRPIFAESFLEVLEDRILQIVATRPRATAREEIMLLVNARFEDWVNSELIIAEAESQLSPEQQMGVLAWLRDLQEGEIIRRGGTRAAAESSLLEEQGLGIEEFLEMRRDRALAVDLLRRRVAPRVIVTSRDIEREFQRRQEEFNPGATIRIGRIWLDRERDGDAIELATRRFAEGATFGEVVAELELPDGGLWREFRLGQEGADEGIAGLELAEDLRDRLIGLPIDRATESFQQGRRTVWLGILEIDQPPQRTLFDPDVQITIRNALQARGEAIERDRYIKSLRERWIAEDIDEMRFRLIDIALRRYWR